MDIIRLSPIHRFFKTERGGIKRIGMETDIHAITLLFFLKIFNYYGTAFFNLSMKINLFQKFAKILANY
jgi:hypothetical protein